MENMEDQQKTKHFDEDLHFGIEEVLHSFCGLLPPVTGYCLCQMQHKEG